MCHAQLHNTVTPVRLEPAAPRSRVKHSTTGQGTSVSNSIDTDQDQHSVIPDLGQNCLQSLKGYGLSADDKNCHLCFG